MPSSIRCLVVRFALLASVLAVNAACSSQAGAPLDAGTNDAHDAPGIICDEITRLAGKCPTLAGYDLFIGNGSTQEPKPGVFRYNVIAPLFADEAVKHRFIRLPLDGEKARYSDRDPWDLPTGSIVVKTFAYPRDARDPAGGEQLIETRLLIRAPSGIVPITYIWNDAQTEAVREVAGLDVHVEWIDEAGLARSTEYGVPTTNDCKRCHGQTDVHLLGVRTRQLDRPSAATGGENQIDALAGQEFFETPPPSGPRDHLVDPQDESAPVEVRGRSYLDANCGHCHNTGAAAEWSGLELDWGDHAAGVLGVCKSPSSAGDTGGLRYDIVPGAPQDSVLLYRMGLTNSAYRMPEGSRRPDGRGLDVIAKWITGLPKDDCTTKTF